MVFEHYRYRIRIHVYQPFPCYATRFLVVASGHEVKLLGVKGNANIPGCLYFVRGKQYSIGRVSTKILHKPDNETRIRNEGFIGKIKEQNILLYRLIRRWTRSPEKGSSTFRNQIIEDDRSWPGNKQVPNGPGGSLFSHFSENGERGRFVLVLGLFHYFKIPTRIISRKPYNWSQNEKENKINRFLVFPLFPCRIIQVHGVLYQVR